MCGRRKELGCGLGCGGVACLTAALVRVSSGGDLAAARARARSRGIKNEGTAEINRSPDATEKEMEKRVLKPREIH